MSLSHRVFEDTSHGEFSVIDIHKMFLEIVSCYGIFQKDTPAVILTLIIKLV